MRQQNQSVATDIVVVVDESASMAFYHAWLSGTITALERALLADSIGIDPNLPNRYALVGFGRSDDPTPHVFETIADGLGPAGVKVVDITRYPNLNRQLREGGNIEDGYLAIEHALTGILDENGNNLLRLGQSNVATNIIFITDEDRDILLPDGAALTRSSIKRTIRQAGAVLNVVVDQELFGDGEQAFGYDSEKTAYIVQPLGTYRNTTVGARLGRGYNSTRRDYTTVALELGGAGWNIRILREGGAVGESFTNAFLTVKAKEVQRQIEQCRTCTCRDQGRRASLQCVVAGDQDACKMDAASGLITFPNP